MSRTTVRSISAVAICTLLLPLLALVAPPASAVPVGTIEAWESEIDQPVDVVTTPDGSVWWTNPPGDFVGRRLPDGQVVTYRDTPSLSRPSSIAAGPDGGVWFTNNGPNGGIGHISVSGVHTHFSGGLNLSAIAAGPDGNMWFVSGNSIVRIAPTGDRTFFSDATIDGASGLVAGPDGNLWFINAGHVLNPPPTYQPTREGASIGRITPDGTVTSFVHPSFNGSDAAFTSLSAITSGPDGKLWFARTTGLGTIATDGTIAFGPAIQDVTDLTVGPDGNVWGVSYMVLHKVTVAGVVTSFPNGFIYNAVSPGPDGDILVASGHDTIWSFSTTGVGTRLPIRGIDASSPVKALDGTLWFLEEGAVSRITPGGQLESFSAPWLRIPDNLVEAPDGSLWFSVESGFGKVDPDGTLTEVPWSRSFQRVSSMLVDADGTVWFTDTYFGSIGTITPEGVVTELPETVNLSTPDSLVEAGDGNLWFVDYQVGSIGRVTPAGDVTLFSAPLRFGPILAGPDGNVWFPAPGAVGRMDLSGAVTTFDLPAGGRVDVLGSGPDGAVWFSGSNTFGRVTVTGAVSTFAVSSPGAFAAGADGNVWVASSFRSIYRVTPTGDTTHFSLGHGSNTETAAWVVTGDDGRIWTHTSRGVLGLQVLPDDEVSVTARFSGQYCTYLQMVADHRGDATPALTVSLGTEILVQLAEQESANPAPVPPNSGPCAVTLTFPSWELGRLEAAADAWDVSVEELVRGGGDVVLAIIYWLAHNS